MPMEETTKSVLEQTFVELHKRTSHASQRMADAADNVAEQTRLGYLESKEKIGVREAEAMRNMNTSKVAQEVLQARSTMNQPQGA